MKTILHARAASDAPVDLHGSLLILLLALLLASLPAWSATYYVAPNGDNLNNGLSLTTPFRTIQKGVDAAVAGDTVYVRGGVYRESVNVWKNGGTDGNMITIQGYNGEVPVVKGSDVVSGWTQYSGAIWKKEGWSVNSQQVFVDFSDGAPSAPLQQIGMPSSLYTTYEYPKPLGSGVSSMVPGSFFYDAAAATLYVWLADGSDPNTHVIEASTRNRTFFMARPYIYLKGFAFRHSNASAVAKQGAAVELSSNSVIDQCDIQYTDFAGLSMGYQQSNTQAINCNISNNGDSGINASQSYNFRIAYVTLKGNNYRNFNAHWHAGGFKGASKSYGTVEFSEISGNNASGLWFDYCNSGSPITIRNNHIHGNGPLEAGIFIEVTTDALIYNNILVNNARRGIYIAASDRSRVFNNTVYGTSVYAAIEVNGMPRTGATLTANTVRNNIVSHSTAKYDLFMAVDDGTTIVGNTSDYNNYYRPAGAIQLYRGSLFTSLSNWIGTTKSDLNSFSVNPGFVKAAPALPADFALASTSPMLDKATVIAEVPQDYAKTPRPAGASHDMGAFELAAPTAAPAPAPAPGDTTAPAVVVKAPLEGQKVLSSLKISATATDNVKVTAMKVYVDGVLKAQSTSGTIAYTWDTRKLAKGSAHYVVVTAADAAGNLTQVSRKVIKS